MKTIWHSTKHPGVRYREHPTRKHGIKPDRYFSIRYQRDGNRTEEGIGWSSEGWSAEKAAIELSELKKAALTGEGPIRLAEKRELDRARREEEEKERTRQDRESTTFGDYFLDRYSPIAEISKKSTSFLREEQQFRKWLEPAIGDTPLAAIAPSHLERIKRNLLDAERSPRTVQYVFATFRQVWNMARRDGFVVEESPSKRIRLPKVDNKRVRFLTHEEADQLLEELRNRSQQLHDVSLLSLHCGLRADECFSLTHGCLDMENETILIKDSRGGTRIGFMTTEVKNMFAGQEEGASNAPAFLNRKGKKIDTISNSFDRAVLDLGLNDGVDDRRQKVVFHTLRHTFGSWHVQNGTDLYVLQKLMGHSTLAMTERYSHLGENTLQAAVKNLERKIAEFKKRDTS